MTLEAGTTTWYVAGTGRAAKLLLRGCDIAGGWLRSQDPTAQLSHTKDERSQQLLQPPSQAQIYFLGHSRQRALWQTES